MDNIFLIFHSYRLLVSDTAANSAGVWSRLRSSCKCVYLQIWITKATLS